MRKIIGLLVIAVAVVLFCSATGNLNKAQSLGNIMSGAPSVAESISLAAIFDLCAALLAFGGVWLAGLRKKSAGMLMIFAGLVCLSIVIWNYLHAPPGDANETDKIPVDIILHLVAVGISAAILLPGIWLRLRNDKKNLE